MRERRPPTEEEIERCIELLNEYHVAYFRMHGEEAIKQMGTGYQNSIGWFLRWGIPVVLTGGPNNPHWELAEHWVAERQVKATDQTPL